MVFYDKTSNVSRVPRTLGSFSSRLSISFWVILGILLSSTILVVGKPQWPGLQQQQQQQQQNRQQLPSRPLWQVWARRNDPPTSSSTSSSTSRQASSTRSSTTTTTSSPPSLSSHPAWVVGLKNSVASGMAAGCSKLILAPFDTIKTLQQHSRTVATSGTAVTQSLSMVDAAKIILQRPRGIIELYSGVGVAVVGGMPSVALYFGVYSYCLKKFSKLDPTKDEQKYRTITIAMSAALGNTVASVSRVPYEVVKQKFQTHIYTNMGDAIKDFTLSNLFPMGGIKSQMLRDVPYAIVTLLAYEHFKRYWKPHCRESFPTIPARAWDMGLGGLAGGIGSYVTNPMDVIKTRLQTDSKQLLYGGSISTCFEQTWAEGGPSVFLRGSATRLLQKVPANAFFFLFYELFRSILCVEDLPPSTTTTRTAVIARRANQQQQQQQQQQRGPLRAVMPTLSGR